MSLSIDGGITIPTLALTIIAYLGYAFQFWTFEQSVLHFAMILAILLALVIDRLEGGR